MTLAVDMSNYTSVLTPENLRALKDAGVHHAIVQAVDPPPGYPVGVTREQIMACLNAGLSVDAYIWLWFDLGIADVQRKLGLLTGLPVRQIWLDVEDTAAIKYDQAACEAKVTEALAACDDVSIVGPTGVYSGRWYWADRRYMGNTTAFSDRELWDALYDDVADAALGFVPYGGWTAPRIKQFRGTTSIAGISGVDLNVLSVAEAAELEPAPPVEQAECDWSWVAKKQRVVELAGELQTVAGQIAAAAARKYGPVRADVQPLAAAVAERAGEILA